MTVKFGTSGLRGLSSDLAGDVSARYCAAFAKFLLSRNLSKPGDFVMIGRDFRESSPAIASICITALRRSGLMPIDCGAVATPALAHYAFSSRSASIMVTGSHIPADRNGIKFYRPNGEITKSDEVQIVELARTLEISTSLQRADGGGAESHCDKVWARFLERNRRVLAPKALSSLRVGVYQHSTVIRDFLVDLLNGFGAEVVVLGRSEDFVAVDTEAVSSETSQLLREWAERYRLDAIVSADGDGDRPLLTDEAGMPLRGDLLGLLTARFVEAKTIVTPVTSNSGLENLENFRVVRTKVGSPYVLSAMASASADGSDGVLGFEANGGVILGSNFAPNGHMLTALPTRDSVLPILAALNMAATQKLSSVSSCFSFPVALSDRLENFATEKSTALMAYLSSSPFNLRAFMSGIGTVKSVNEVDGLRVMMSDATIVHLRASGNAPEMRCYVEASTQERAEALLVASLGRVQAFDVAQTSDETQMRKENTDRSAFEIS